MAAGGLQGVPLLLDLQAEKDYWLGTYEPELQQAVHDWLRPGMVVYDVGANVGYISLLLARAAGPRRARCSPSSRCRPTWSACRPISASTRGRASPASRPRWSTVPARCASWRTPRGPWARPPARPGATTSPTRPRSRSPGISLDEFAYPAQGAAPPAWSGPLPQLIKMDIEGGEVLALQGMDRLLSEARPLLLLELHGPESARAAWDTLTAARYYLLRMQPGYPPIPSLDALDWKAYIIARPEET